MTNQRPELTMEPGDRPNSVRCTITWPGALPRLAEVVPLFDQLGVSVADHIPLDRTDPMTPRDAYVLELPASGSGNADALPSAFAAAWTGDTEVDGLSPLILTAGVSWREVAVIRAACRYLRQAGLQFSPAYIDETVRACPAFVCALLTAFHARFDPEHTCPSRARDAAAHVDELLAGTATLDQDRILRGLRDVFAAVLRTNFYQQEGDGRSKRHVTLKIDSSGLEFLPLPRPAVETFVSAPTVEGLHLRGARVARGGIRASDRPEDFRTEVLGLMKAQLVKNAVIVPAGAKGAFVARGGADVRDAYATFVGGLLDVTDNLVDGEIVPPARCVSYDRPDPYLVVAADKGTATFSDLANAIAAERGFWLGDAFASGGSSGYDHKGMGITARGAWTAVTRHFDEIGIDVRTEPVLVAGVGDMSGDVFGNGMLRSRQLRLIGAFDHRHIFLDPDPDPEISFRERARLAALPGSTWADYDPALISAGGGVFPRGAKSVPLSQPVQARLQVDADELPPAEVIRALLRAPVDLLWNGGIGTYVKASTESHADAGDRAGDPVRVDADSLRCAVIGEGGNLGLTQRARIEFARRGGRCNTDFIDNAAGVDTSDREVNLKILLDGAVADGEIGRDERNRLLRSLEDEVAAAVLTDTARQVRAISVSLAQAPFLLDRHARLIHNLEEQAGLDRSVEHLPTEADIERRRSRGEGLTRPELAVLLAYSKNLVRAELLAAGQPEDPARVAAGYFPRDVRDRFGHRIARHPLVREIAATMLANDLIDRVGPGFLYRLEERTGAATPAAARAFAAVQQVFDLPWASADALAPAAEQAVLRELQAVAEHTAEALLYREDVAGAYRRYRAPVGELAAYSAGSSRARARRDRLVTAGVPEELSARVAVLAGLTHALDLVDAAVELGEPVTTIAARHDALGERFDLPWLSDQLEPAPADAYWTQAAKAALREEVVEQWVRLTRASVAGLHPPPDRVRALVDQLRAQATVEFAMLVVAVRELRRAAAARD
ncbi:NAD-glutamate dehydrogenase domain-containing protein [Actinoplanes sp. URMC 104]|uniref:NAD-glutamate dehydrogenase domain-containing protein n=1 Tax=Actinoplanes sp. URMC 104 TaxID=3423409 RepID=UPI003F1E0F28